MPIATNRFFVENGGNDTGAGSVPGRDLLGLSLSGATYDHTGNGEGERHLSSAAAFAGYTFASGDKIYLVTGGTITTGLYEVASKVDGDAILLVADSGLTGDDTVTSSDGPWATTQFASDTATTAGSDIYLSDAATETPAATIDIDQAVGAIGDPIRFIGCDSAGNRLTTGFYTISGASLGGGVSLITEGITASFIHWEGVRFTGGKGNNIEDTNTGTRWDFKRCRIDSATAMGVRMRSIELWSFTDCEIDSNGSDGLGTDVAGRGFLDMIRCKIHDNTGIGVDARRAQPGEASVYADCEVYDNTGVGIKLYTEGKIIGCTIYINDGNGIDIASNGRLVIANNTLAANGGYGLDTNGAAENDFSYCDYNHFYDNRNGIGGEHADIVSNANINDGTIGTNNQVGDPTFTTVTDGSENFIPLDGSPLKQNGLMAVDIGARRSADAAGGGTTSFVIGS